MPTPDTAAPSPTQARHPGRIDARTHRGRLQMLFLLLVCASPVIASYFTYYVIRPTGGTTNYGALVDPQRPAPAISLTDEQGQPVPMAALRGKWLLLMAAPANCDEACVRRLFTIRQIRAGQGEDSARILPVWLVTDDKPIDPRLAAAYNEPYAGVRFLRAPRDVVLKWLPAGDGLNAEDTIYLVDPLGNLMMRFPADPDPKKMSSDLKKLLKYSRIG